MDLAHYFETMKGKEVFTTREIMSRFLLFFDDDMILPLIEPDKER